MSLGAFGDEGDCCDCLDSDGDCDDWPDSDPFGDEFWRQEDESRADACLDARLSSGPGSTYRCGDCEYCRAGFDLCVPVPNDPCSCPGPRCSCIARPNNHGARFVRIGVSWFLVSDFDGEPSAPLRCA